MLLLFVAQWGLPVSVISLLRGCSVRRRSGSPSRERAHSRSADAGAELTWSEGGDLLEVFYEAPAELYRVTYAYGPDGLSQRLQDWGDNGQAVQALSLSYDGGRVAEATLDTNGDGLLDQGYGYQWDGAQLIWRGWDVGADGQVDRAWQYGWAQERLLWLGQDLDGEGGPDSAGVYVYDGRGLLEYETPTGTRYEAEGGGRRHWASLLEPLAPELAPPDPLVGRW